MTTKGQITVPKDVRQRLIALPLPERGQAPEEILEFLQRHRQQRILDVRDVFRPWTSARPAGLDLYRFSDCHRFAAGLC